tara:strand:- start:432 stop:683 length:252 start_codon:yes stop_codon:yes gene_type:complete
MDFIKREKDEKLDIEKLTEGVYSFSDKEGFVEIKVDKNGTQSWNLENWFASLDPDKSEEDQEKIINEIKQRLKKNQGNSSHIG